jgi:hypothetical protein
VQAMSLALIGTYEFFPQLVIQSVARKLEEGRTAKIVVPGPAAASSLG